jgi:hypothetical protein
MLDERFEAHRRAPETSIPWEEVGALLSRWKTEAPSSVSGNGASLFQS